MNDMSWIGPVVGAVGDLIAQWLAARDAKDSAAMAAVEARAQAAIAAMVADRKSTADEHDALTAETRKRLEGESER